MPRFTIMHIYEVFAKNQYDATDELMRARAGKYDKVYLKKVLVKDAEELQPFRHKVNVFEDKPPAKMTTIFQAANHRQMVDTFSPHCQCLIAPDSRRGVPRPTHPVMTTNGRIGCLSCPHVISVARPELIW